MRKHVFGRQFKRDANERKALFKGLINELVIRESITTTEEKAKAIKGRAEKIVTKAKKRRGEARQFLQPYLSPVALEKVIKDLSIRFADRPGGYTRVIKLGKRVSDNASMALIEWVEKAIKAEVVAPTGRRQKSVPETKKLIEAKIAVNQEKENHVKKSKKALKEEKKETKKK